MTSPPEATNPQPARRPPIGNFHHIRDTTHILVQEIVCELDDATNEAVLLIHWTGGRHSELRVPRVKTGRYPSDMAPAAADALRKLAGHWSDRELAVSLNRMRCKSGDGETWTTVRVREMRERLGIAAYDSAKADTQSPTEN